MSIGCIYLKYHQLRSQRCHLCYVDRYVIYQLGNIIKSEHSVNLTTRGTVAIFECCVQFINDPLNHLMLLASNVS